MLETLEQVCTAEPVPPSRLVPGVSRDLETIALKCLEKSPSRRYASAAALAEDLGLFLEDRPIRARRVGAIGRLHRWCRRYPGIAGMAAMVIMLGLVVLIVAVTAAVRIAASAAHEPTLYLRG